MTVLRGTLRPVTIGIIPAGSLNRRGDEQVGCHFINDDLIVGGSMCVGLGCADGEDFLFDTIRLISDNPQISFEDTSTVAEFPTQDWTIGMEDGPSGTSVFFVKDATV